MSFTPASGVLSDAAAEHLPSRRADESTWRQRMKSAVRDADELCRRLNLSEAWLTAARLAEKEFPVFAPLGYIARMKPRDSADPLLRQVLPVEEELRTVPGFVSDPVGDGAATRTPGMLQKYAGRVLLVTTGACAIHCRYCFRRHFPYSEGPRSLTEWEPALKQIAADTTLDEVILSGGDPLTLVDEMLAALAERLAAIPHLKRLRVHSRLPIVIPERVTSELLGWFTGTRLAAYMVVHANHPAEIDATVAAALGRLVDAGVPTLNQAVLLRGVNDDVASLEQLCRTLVDLRVQPYYLHQLDRVAGAAHFEVPPSRGLELIAALQTRLPGYAVPRFVREVSGGTSKEAVVLGGEGA